MRARIPFVLVVLLSWVLTGCGDDAASPPIDRPTDPTVDLSRDPAMLEVLGILDEFRTRTVLSGVGGDGVLEAFASDDPFALSRRIGYSDEAIAARTERLRSAIEDLRDRYGPVEAGSSTADGGAAFAASIDADPTLPLARQEIYLVCEIVGLLRDAFSCHAGYNILSDEYIGCMIGAVCDNCIGLAGLC